MTTRGKRETDCAVQALGFRILRSQRRSGLRIDAFQRRNPGIASTMPPLTVHARLIGHLRDAGIEFREVTHEPTLTSEDSARARGEPLGVGAKALVLKCDGAFRLVVLPADRKLGTKLLKTALGVKDVRFATREELLTLTGLVPGSVPPFGEPILPLPLFADKDVGMRFPRVAFNAGDLCRSVVMSAADWERLARPTRIACAEAES
jgi:Ala-tRNA(Pro) deacylase